MGDLDAGHGLSGCCYRVWGLDFLGLSLGSIFGVHFWGIFWGIFWAYILGFILGLYFGGIFWVYFGGLFGASRPRLSSPTCLYTNYGLYSYGLYSYGVCSYGLWGLDQGSHCQPVAAAAATSGVAMGGWGDRRRDRRAAAVLWHKPRRARTEANSATETGADTFRPPSL